MFICWGSTNRACCYVGWESHDCLFGWSCHLTVLINKIGAATYWKKKLISLICCRSLNLLVVWPWHCSTVKMPLFLSRSNKCFCDGAIPSCLHSDALPMVKEGNECCFIEKNCSSFKELCNPAWLAPLNIPALATILHCEVVDSGIGPYINSNRYQLVLLSILWQANLQ